MKADKGVALKYFNKKNIPEIVAIARGKLLKKMIEIAKKNNITVYKDKNVAEILSVLEIGSEIPEELYKSIAEVLAFCYKANRNFREKFDKNEQN